MNLIWFELINDEIRIGIGTSIEPNLFIEYDAIENNCYLEYGNCLDLLKDYYVTGMYIDLNLNRMFKVNFWLMFYYVLIDNFKS